VVGWWSRLRDTAKTTSASRNGLALHASGFVEVVGESRRQNELRRVAKAASTARPFLEELSGQALSRAKYEDDRKWFRAVLLAEPHNPVDKKAIAVYADGVGQIGYLSRENARAYQRVFQELGRHGTSVGTCPAFLIGGEPGKPSYGAVLCLSSPRAVVLDLAAE
jgi:hypothetical protein